MLPPTERDDMATSEMREVIQHLRRTALLRDGVGLTDGQLLEDYISRRDEAAVAALVRRHGPMVWCVCRRVLHNLQDAEDAFQATFLVLVRRPAAVVPREMVANWLYGVAHRTALKARATIAGRRARERQVPQMPEPAEAEQGPRADLRPLLDEELSRLGDKYRVVIVLCDLEGKTRKEAARQLGCPEGTIAGRLARARALLATRLARHGLVVSGVTLGTVLSEKFVSAAVPTQVLSSTLEAVIPIAAGQAAAPGAISIKVAALTEGMLKTMMLWKLKTAGAALVVMLGLVALGGGLFTCQTEAAQDGEQPAKSKAAQAKAPSPPRVAKQAKLSAKQIVERMAKTYADCKSYRDSGMVKTLFVGPVGNRTVEKPFTTAFVRPDRFRFDYKEMIGDEEKRFLIQAKAKEVRTWWDVKPGVEKPESLALALGGAAGVSSLSSLNIPQLLLPDKMGRSRLVLAEPKRAEDAKLGKVDCFRVEGKFGANPMRRQRLLLWIDKKTYLVRQIDEQALFDDFRTEQTTTYDPTIDGKIADKLLEFDPPAPK
jgi:RNA polymerase sigma factor (sigma-70 family)